MSESRQPWRKLAGFGILEVAILPTVYIITKYYSILRYIIVKKALSGFSFTAAFLREDRKEPERGASYLQAEVPLGEPSFPEDRAC